MKLPEYLYEKTLAELPIRSSGYILPQDLYILKDGTCCINESAIYKKPKTGLYSLPIERTGEDSYEVDFRSGNFDYKWERVYRDPEPGAITNLTIKKHTIYYHL